MEDIKGLDQVVQNAGGGNIFSIEGDGPFGYNNFDIIKDLNVVEKYVIRNTPLQDKAYITWGAKNQHPNFLLDLYKKSGMHKAIVISKTELATGRGITLNGEDSDEAMEYLDSVGLTNKMVIKSCLSDVVLYGSFAMELAYKVNINEGKREVESYYKHDLGDFRLSPPEKDEKGRYYNKRALLHGTWKRALKKDILEVPMFFLSGDKDRRVENDGLLMYYGKMQSPDGKWYGVPDYFSETGVHAILLDNELAMFDVADLQNGLTSGYIVTFVRQNFAGIDKKKEERIRQQERDLVYGEMTGSQNQGNVMILRAEPDADGKHAKKVHIEPIPTNNTGDRHKIMNDRKNLNMLIAHGLPAPEIASIPDLTKAGFASEAARIREAIKLMMYTRIRSYRDVYSEFINNVLKDAEFVSKCEFIDDMPLVETVSKAMYDSYYLDDEVREAEGMSTLDEAQKIELKEKRIILGLGKVEQPKPDAQQTKLNLNDGN